MSSPYIQVEIDAAKKAPTLASALGISLREAMGGLTLMWLHIYGAGKGDTVTAFYLRTFFGVDPALVSEALIELGFVERLSSTEWRVKGAGRYTRLTDARREAGRKGAAATNGKRSASAAANVEDGRQVPTKPRQRSANVRQVPPEVAHEPASAAANIEDGRQVPRQNPENGRQKAALDPRSDISSPTGKRDIGSENAAPVGVPLQPLPPPAGGAAGGTTKPSEEGSSANRSGNAKPPKPPRPPKPVEGTPEYAEAVALGDWQLLRWGPYADKPGEEARP